MPRYSRATTYNQNGVPAIQADDLNALQDDDVDLWSAITGRDTLIDDEFTGDSLRRDLWLNETNGITFPDDSAAGADGAIQVSPTSDATTAFIQTQKLAIGLNDFRLIARARITALTANSAVQIGINPLSGSNQFCFDAETTSPNWKLDVGGVATDLGVPYGAVYQLLEIRRESGFVSVWIDGSKRFSGPLTTDFTGKIVGFQVHRFSGANTMLCDKFKFWRRV